MKPEDLLSPTPAGLYCAPGDFYIDPVRAVPRAVITHGHADHARAGHGAVLASPETLAIMAVRYGESFTASRQPLSPGEHCTVNGVDVSLAPAGHVLGSAQAVVEKDGCRIVCSGDYKRRADPTCDPFEVVPCDVFITEATFGLPVFRHPPAEGEIEKLLRSLNLFPERPHLVGAYALGKAQRVIRMIREAGHDAPIYYHGAIVKLTELYQSFGHDFGDLRPVAGADPADLAGRIIIAPPGARADRWSQRLKDPLTAFASGWMRVRARARQAGVELPLIMSDHADWDELTQTIAETGASEIWVTHGREEALVRHCELRQLKARPLSLVGYDEDGGDTLDATDAGAPA